MRTEAFFGWLIALATISNAAAMHTTHMPRMTHMPRAEPTSTSTISADPWQCVTENVTQYFNVPTPTGDLRTALVSYGEKLLGPCLATATEIDKLLCSITDTTAWCGFATAAPSAVLADYSSYISLAASFWRAKSETISIVSSRCPLWWARPSEGEHIWLNQIITHGKCYIAEHQVEIATTTASTGMTSTSIIDSASTVSGAKPTTNGVLNRHLGVEALVLASTGLIAAMHVAW